MAILTGAIKYRGSFKSIRNYVTLHDANVYAGEKGGANRNLILNNPAFVRTRENMSEFAGVGIAAKAIRHGILNLLPEQVDKHFTARLIQVVKAINLRDVEGMRGKRSISFSLDRPLLLNLIFSVFEDVTDLVKNQFAWVHPISRAEATLTLTDFLVKKVYVPKGATHYRVQNHLSIVSDYTYSEASRRYEPLSQLNEMSTHTYSEYTTVGTALTNEIKAAFPTGTTPSDTDTVILCVGVEFYQKSSASTYLPLKGSSMLVLDVF